MTCPPRIWQLLRVVGSIKLLEERFPQHQMVITPYEAIHSPNQQRSLDSIRKLEIGIHAAVEDRMRDVIRHGVAGDISVVRGNTLQ